MIVRLLVPVALVATAMAGVAGCKDKDSTRGTAADKESAPPSNAPSGDDAVKTFQVCSLLTKAEIGEATGTTVTKQEETNYAMKGCANTLEAGGSLNLAVVLEKAKPMFEATKEGNEPVDGVGDAAYFEKGRPSGNLVVLHGDKMLYVQPYFEKEDDVRLEVAKKLAQMALKRL